jgi:hypothetical protein
MVSIRTVTTKSKATAVQLVHYEQRKVVADAHIGSGRTTDEVAALLARAAILKEDLEKQSSLFTHPPSTLGRLTFRGISHSFTRSVWLSVAELCGLASLDSLLLDLALMRIVEPCSKRRTLELLQKYFGITYAERTVYRTLPKLLKQKDAIEKLVVTCATDRLTCDISLVLYDVTTLYFESFEADELRTPGFSKDHKANQPQIVVGLLVTRDGFPLGYEVFKGNTFEGHTMLPTVRDFAKRYKVAVPCVVGDAAMISKANVEQLTKDNYSYIVGARLANVSPKLLMQIAKLPQVDGATLRIPTDSGDLVVGFSALRFRKDTNELKKQLERAAALVKKGEPGKRARFVQKMDEKYVLDEALKTKATQLLGIKGYYTNLKEVDVSDTEVIARYHDLWHVEAAFRMSKHDLATRPIFHHTEDAVRAHVLICFVALVLGTYAEKKAGQSLRSIMDSLWDVVDAKVTDSLTKEERVLRVELEPATAAMVKKIGVSY